MQLKIWKIKYKLRNGRNQLTVINNNWNLDFTFELLHLDYYVLISHFRSNNSIHS